MQPKDLCLQLVHADSEEEVIKILSKAGYWENNSAWVPFNNDDGNWSTIGNQSAKADSAMVEKIINSVDAMLMGECKARGEDPESSSAPSSIEDAVNKYFNVPRGRLAHITANERSELAGNIRLVATGKKNTPCYSIIDKGEGQSPTTMKQTILALSRSNKNNIRFVQGKFHMGGTGVMRFLGPAKLQLILSRRRPEIAQSEGSPLGDEWGFTMLRRQTPEKGKSSVITYLAPENGKGLLHFKAESLPLFPGEYPEAYVEPMEYGMFIKLYEYEMKGLKSPLRFDAYYRLSVLLPTLALPVRLQERRKGYKAENPDSTLAGLKVRLEAESAENILEAGFPDSASLKIEGEKMGVTIYVFKKGKAVNYRWEEGIIFTINGQTHGQINDPFFRRTNVGMSYLADSILVICDCSEFSLASREDLFMNSRDRLSEDSKLRAPIERGLEKLIAEHPGLRELKNKRKQEALGEKLADSKPFADLLKKVMKVHPSIAHLFAPTGNRLQSPFDFKNAGKGEEYKGKKYPTYFRIAKKPKTGVVQKRCPINRTCRFEFETDVVNDYFDRDEFPGTFQLTVGGNPTEDYRLHLWNGIASLTVKLPSDSVSGELLEFKAKVTDHTQADPFYEEFQVVCEEEKKKIKPPKPGPVPPEPPEDPSPPDDEDNSENQETPKDLGLPDVKEVRKSDVDLWKDHKFDEYTGLKVIYDGEGSYQFYINMHNLYLLHEIKAQALAEPQLLEAQYKYGMTLIGMALLQSKRTDKTAVDDQKPEDENMETTVASVTRSIAPVLIPLIHSLGEMEI